MTNDLIIVGGGPAGCAAALMAGSVGMRTVLVEQSASLCSKVERIPVLGNVLGGHRTGPDFARAVARDLERSDCDLLLRKAVVSIGAGHEREVVLEDGTVLHGENVLIATGVRPQPVAAARWIRSNSEVPQLWHTAPEVLEKGRVLVLGADRPLGTLLRAYPNAEFEFEVLYTDDDQYKTLEVAGDARVHLHHVAATSLTRTQNGWRAEVQRSLDASLHGLTADWVVNNLGSEPTQLAGDLYPDAAGYLPSALQHPHVLTAGDIRSPQGQRIMTATGSGADACLAAYYSTQGAAR